MRLEILEIRPSAGRFRSSFQLNFCRHILVSGNRYPELSRVRSLPRACASRLRPLHTNCRELRRVGPAFAPSLLHPPNPFIPNVLGEPGTYTMVKKPQAFLGSS